MTTLWNGPINTNPETLQAAAELLDARIDTWGNSNVRFSYKVGETTVTITGRALSTVGTKTYYAHARILPTNRPITTCYRLDDIAFTGKGSRNISIVEQEKAARELLAVGEQEGAPRVTVTLA